jgi:hypothetical protein
MDSIDGDACLCGVMGFITLRPGDTDKEYFDGYTVEQMEWVEQEAEQLQMWGMEEAIGQFKDWRKDGQS